MLPVFSDPRILKFPSIILDFEKIVNLDYTEFSKYFKKIS